MLDHDSEINDEISEIGPKSKSLHAHMKSNIVRNARQIVDKRSLDEDDDCDIEQLNQRITKMETMLLIIVDKLNSLAEKRRCD